MKVLLFFSSLEMGGAERQGINFAKYLQSEGIEVVVVGIGIKGKVDEICSLNGIECRGLLAHNTLYNMGIKIMHKLHLKRYSNEEIALLPMAYELDRLIKQYKIDICVSYCTVANTILGLVKKNNKGIKCVWYQRDAGIFDKEEGLQVQAINAMDCIIANSRSGRDWLLKAYGKEASIIYNGVKLDAPIDDRSSWRKRLGIEDKDILCTMIANLSREKDHLFLLYVLKKLLQNGKNIKFAFAGRYASEYATLKSYSESNGLDSSVLFLGQVEDVSGLISASDICIFGAKSEGSPNGIIECEMGRLPVVATDIPEIRDVVSEANIDYLYQCGNVDDAVEKVQSLADNPEERVRIGYSNYLKVNKDFNYVNNFKKLLETICI